jgi:hypothetical protein
MAFAHGAGDGHAPSDGSLQKRLTSDHMRCTRHETRLDFLPPERGELRGEKSFHIFVLPDAGSQQWTHRLANAGT